MTPAAKLLITVLGNVAEISLLVAWKGFGVDAAGNLLLFWLWFCTVVGTLLWLAPVTGATIRAGPRHQRHDGDCGHWCARLVRALRGSQLLHVWSAGAACLLPAAAEACLASVKDDD
ncbi:hypothetical protein [Cupriavidus sp. amp6]|uniref:hypothetical protein n=1 Tax=Cupriavidus sp. amp6 TaxID=388051 RepID=UPI00048ADDF2|nr:hypothetical protein [Cupriavidus sp. amp6]